MLLSGDKIIISRDTMFRYNMPDGDYTLTLRSFGYKNVYDVDVLGYKSKIIQSLTSTASKKNES